MRFQCLWSCGALNFSLNSTPKSSDYFSNSLPNNTTRGMSGAPCRTRLQWMARDNHVDQRAVRHADAQKAGVAVGGLM